MILEILHLGNVTYSTKVAVKFIYKTSMTWSYSRTDLRYMVEEEEMLIFRFFCFSLLK